MKYTVHILYPLTQYDTLSCTYLVSTKKTGQHRLFSKLEHINFCSHHALKLPFSETCRFVTLYGFLFRNYTVLYCYEQVTTYRFVMLYQYVTYRFVVYRSVMHPRVIYCYVMYCYVTYSSVMYRNVPPPLKSSISKLVPL
jgi:hypothetical protein